MRDRSRESRRKRQAVHDTKDRWMITYADLITLLLIFFVVMYAMSRLDVEKYDIVTQSLQLTFKSGDSLIEKGTGILGTEDQYDFKNPPSDQGNNENGAVGNDSDANSEDDSTKPLTDRELAFRKQEEDLQNLMKRIQTYVKDNQLEDQIHVNDLPKGISITLSDRFLFDTGKAELKSGSAKTLSKLASLFSDLDTAISIEGHTDSEPIVRASTYKDNWELSGARALSVLRYFIDKEKLDPNGFQYAGYADTRPAADNSTAQGRAKNRRVEITVLRQLQQ
ncbi:Chemotaxis protein LafU [compost metagenome]